MTHRTLFRCMLGLIAAGTLAACGSDSKSSSTTAAAAATTAAAPTTAAPATTAAAATTTAGGGGPVYQIPNSIPATSAAPSTAAAASSFSLGLRDDPSLGKILVDSEGWTLYLFTKDTGTTSVCTGDCAAAWPPATVTGTPTAGDGIDASMLSASAQPDGTMQLTYNGHLLYRYAPDGGPGQTKGQDVGGVWYTVDATGNKVDKDEESEPSAAPATAASLSLRDDPTLGKILVDSEGWTLYLFTKDTGTTSACTGGCATAWPAAVVTGTPTPGDGIDASLLSASAQPDGTMQLTYNGHLLYRYAPDGGPGQTTGQDVGGVWYTVDATGNKVDKD